MNTIKATVEQLSIRSRFAFGMLCLEGWCVKFSVDQLKMKDFFEVLWRFTDTDSLDKWEKIADQYVPGTVEDVELWLGVSNYDDEFKEDFLDLVLQVWGVATENLYYAVSSEETIDEVMMIASIMNKHQVELPSLLPLMKSLIDEERGWGRNHKRGYYIDIEEDK